MAPGLARCRAAKTSCGNGERRHRPERPPQQPEQQRPHPEFLGDRRLHGQAEPRPRRRRAGQGDVVEAGDGQDAHQDRHHEQTETRPDGEPGHRRPERELAGPAPLTQSDGEGVAAEGGRAGDEQPGKLQGRISAGSRSTAACNGSPNAAAVRKNTSTEPPERPQPAPTAGMQNAAFAELDRYAPAVGSGRPGRRAGG